MNTKFHIHKASAPKILFWFFTVAFLIFLPEILDACPMCQSGYSKKQVSAYKGTTLLLALIPMVGGSGLFYWLYLKFKKRAHSGEATQ